MIRQLKFLFDWLDRMFPAKVNVVRDWVLGVDSNFRSIDDRFLGFLDYCSRTNKRIDSLEESIKAIKESLAKNGAGSVKVESEVMRERFVRGELHRSHSASDEITRSMG